MVAGCDVVGWWSPMAIVMVTVGDDGDQNGDDGHNDDDRNRQLPN